MKPVPADIRISDLSMVILYARDPMASLGFYRDLLGMRVLEASPHWVELDGGGARLALHHHEAMPATRDPALPWVVFRVEDVRGAHEALRSRGAKFLCEPKQVCADEKSVGLSADLLDPDGNRISIFGTVPAGA